VRLAEDEISLGRLVDADGGQFHSLPPSVHRG
jgi:hypothetical protein